MYTIKLLVLLSGLEGDELAGRRAVEALSRVGWLSTRFLFRILLDAVV
jgi:hypothetical protein